MGSLKLVKNSFNESIQTKIDSADSLPEDVAIAGDHITQALIQGKKLLVCGEGVHAALSQIFTTHLLHRINIERPSLPIISLSDNLSLYSAINSDTGANEVFARQVRALGDAGDILLTISHDGESFACAQAIRAGLNKDMAIISLTGDSGGEIAGLTGPDDIEIRVPSANPLKIVEVHLMILNSIAYLVDINLFGDTGS